MRLVILVRQLHRRHFITDCYAYGLNISRGIVNHSFNYECSSNNFMRRNRTHWDSNVTSMLFGFILYRFQFPTNGSFFGELEV